MHFKDTLPVWSAAKGWKGPAPNEEEEVRVAKQHGLAPSRHAIYQSFGAGGVDFPGLIKLLRERNYDGWISLDFNSVDLPPGVSVEQEMGAHRKLTNLTETLNASMKRRRCRVSGYAKSAHTNRSQSSTPAFDEQ